MFVSEHRFMQWWCVCSRAGLSLMILGVSREKQSQRDVQETAEKPSGVGAEKTRRKRKVSVGSFSFLTHARSEIEESHL